MAMHDITNGLLREGETLALSGTTPAATSALDMQDVDAVNIDIHTNTVTDAGTASGFSFEIQESDDTVGANFTAVADADLTNAESLLTVTADTDDDAYIGSIGYIGSKRYLRVVGTGTTGTNAGVKVAFLGRPELKRSVVNDAGTGFNELTLTATS